MKVRYISTLMLLLVCNIAFSTESDSIIVTATRTAQTADETLASVTVITREDIEQRQAHSVQDVLRGVPGISIANSGGPGKTTSVFMRGAESDHLLVLVDGVKVGSATAGSTAFQNIPIEQIDRIEIVRGPHSSLYGSEAIGGVIQIFTRKGGGTLKPFFSVGGGSYNTYTASAGVSGGGQHGWFNLSASNFDTVGFDACRSEAVANFAGCFTDEPDKDGYRNSSGTLRAGYRFENGIEVDAHALRATGNSEFDGGFQNEAESVQQILGGTMHISPSDIWHITLALGRGQDESDNFKDGVFVSRFDTERDTFSWQNDLSITEEHLLSLGFDYRDDQIDSTTSFAVTSRDYKGLFVQYQGNVGRHDLQLSLRRDDIERLGKHSTGGLAWGYPLSKTLRLTANYGTAFKAPTFNELYFPGFGNAALLPEESRSLELGLSGKIDQGRWSLNAFETRVDNLIAADASAGFTAANIEEARIRGLEAVLTQQLKGWDFNTNLTLLDPVNRSSGTNHGNLLVRRAEQSLRLDVDRSTGKLRYGATVFAEGRRFDNLANTRKLGGYAIVDLRTEYAFAKNWRLQARIENLFDKDYETASFFNQPGLSAFITVRYQA